MFERFLQARQHERDRSELGRLLKGIRQSYGLMVNYLYDLDEIETNQEAFINGSVSASGAVTSLI